MHVVVDANEIFSLLIKGSKSSEYLLFSGRITLIAPEFLLEEFSKNKEEILSKTHRSEEDFSKLLSILYRRIKLIPEEEFEERIKGAIKLLPEHTKDAPYLALALEYQAPIWSEDKQLKKQSKIEVLNTKELLEKLRLL